MKTTIEAALSSAKPKASSDAGYDDLNKLIKLYLDDANTRSIWLQRIPALQNDVSKMMSSWDTIPLMIGLYARMIIDGYQAGQMLGLSVEEDRAIQVALTSLRSKLATYKKVEVNTPTRQLYDNLRQIA